MAALLLAGLEVRAAHAAQVLTGKPDDTLSATVSRTEPTLIRIEDQRIRRVFGAEGDFSVVADKDAGTVFIQPTTDKTAFSVFVADEAGRTWRLLLAVADGPSESILIKGRSTPAMAKTAGRAASRVQAIKQTVLALESSDEGGFDTRETNELVPLWKEAMFVLVKVVNGPLRGEKYLLTNVSDKPMVIDERELYRRGVLAVSVERPELKPAETTAVYVISEASHD